MDALMLNYGTDEEDEQLSETQQGDNATVLEALEVVREVAQATDTTAAPPVPLVVPDVDVLSLTSSKVVIGGAQSPESGMVIISTEMAEASVPAPTPVEEAMDECWLPPEIAQEPEGACPADLQEKVSQYIAKQEENGTTIIAHLKQLQAYKNPDFLQHCVKYDDIKEHGSCYPKDVFDPYNLPAEDYFDKLLLEWNEMDIKRRMERETNKKIEFQHQAQKELAQRAVVPPRATSASRAQAEAFLRKPSKSKWDYVRR